MMPDNNKDDMEKREQGRLEQIVTEALLREQAVRPDVEGEWQKMAARLSRQPDTSAPVVPLSEEEPDQRLGLRALWKVVAAVAAIALVVVLLSVKGLQADKAPLYQAHAMPHDIVIVDDQDHERVVKGNELRLAVATGRAQEHTVVVPEGKDVKVTLADGTVVWLNANSRLTYPTVFTGKERKVTLQGEAYFKVAHDAHHPFIVKAGDMQTQVLGTEFNINAMDAEHPHVTLVQGSVRVSASQNGLVIVPGEDAAVDAQGEIKVSHVDVNDVTCWKDGIQFFDNVSLRDILVQMGSWYNMNVVCHDEALLNTHLRYMYDRRQGIEEAVKMLNNISNNKIKLHNNTILIE